MYWTKNLPHVYNYVLSNKGVLAAILPSCLFFGLRIAPTFCDRQVQANNNTVKGRGQSGAERGGGTPPAKLSDPSCLENVLDEELIECARNEEVKCEALATSQAQIDDFSSASFWKI